MSVPTSERNVSQGTDARASRIASSDQLFLQHLERHYPLATSRGAVMGFVYAHNFHDKYIRLHGERPSRAVTDPLKDLLDNVVAKGMFLEIEQIPHTETRHDGSEGPKELQYAGKEAASLTGTNGAGREIKTSMISDVLEGTGFASRLEDGASSTLAVTRRGEIMPTPPGNGYYMVKLVAPPKANDLAKQGGFSLDNSHEENLDNLIHAYGVKPSELTQVTMNPAKRVINQPFVDAAKRVGVRLRIIDAGDMLPGLLACQDPNKTGKLILLATRGGFEEGVIVDAATVVMGGFMEARYYHQDHPEDYMNNPLWTASDLVSGSKDTTLVSISAVTPDNEWLGTPGIERLDNGLYVAHTVTFSKDGMQRSKRTYLANGSLIAA